MDPSSSRPPELPRWLRGHLIGMHASILRGMDAEERVVELAYDSIREFLRNARLESGPAPAKRLLPLLTLPTSTLRLLHKVVSDEFWGLRDYHAPIEDALVWLEGETGAAINGRRWAMQAIFGSGTARRLCQLGRSLAKPAKRLAWNDLEYDPDAMDRMEGLLRSLRDPSRVTEERRKDVDALMACLPEKGAFVAQVEIALHGALHCWPLLILDDKTASENLDERVALTVPMGVDLAYDGEARTETLPLTSSALDLTPWHGPLSEAADAARELWRDEHPRDPRFSVKFDLHPADALAQHLRAAGIGTVTVKDRSATAYLFAQILARRSGQPASISIVSGSIGKKMDDLDVPDYEYEPPEAIEQKLRAVFDSRAWTRIVLPEGALKNQKVCAEIQKYQQRQYCHVEITFAKTLRTLADAVLCESWRGWQFLRCGSLRQTVGKMATRPPTSQDVSAPQLIVRSTRRPEDVARELLPLRQHGITCAFVRLLEMELGEYFWHIVAHVCGVPEAETAELFVNTPQTGIADAIAEILNRGLRGRASVGNRAPDVLVLIMPGTKRPDAPNPSRFAYHADRVLEELTSRELLQRSDLAAKNRLPRIVILEQKQAPDVNAAAPTSRFASLMPPLQGVLVDLAAFPAGFNPTAALRFLMRFYEDRPPISLLLFEEKVLLPLVKLEALLIEDGLYFVSSMWRTFLLARPRTAADSARRLLCAAWALAPYIDEKSSPTAAFDRAVMPTVAHEALHLLWEAREKGDAQGAKCDQALAYLYLHVVPPCWSSARQLGRLGMEEPAEKFVSRLLEGAGKDVHPAHLVIAGQIAQRLALKRRLDLNLKDHKAIADDLDEKAETRYRKALDCAERECLPASEYAYNKLLAISHLGEQLAARRLASTGRVSVDELEQLWNETKVLVQRVSNGDGLNSAWFERMGDLREDPHLALECYQLGVKHAPDWAQSRAKAIGAAQLGRLMDDEVEAELRGSKPLEDMLKRCLDACADDEAMPLARAHVRARWDAFLRWAERQGNTDRELLASLKARRNWRQYGARARRKSARSPGTTRR